MVKTISVMNVKHGKWNIKCTKFIIKLLYSQLLKMSVSINLSQRYCCYVQVDISDIDSEFLSLVAALDKQKTSQALVQMWSCRSDFSRSVSAILLYFTVGLSQFWTKLGQSVNYALHVFERHSHKPHMASKLSRKADGCWHCWVTNVIHTRVQCM